MVNFFISCGILLAASITNFQNPSIFDRFIVKKLYLRFFGTPYIPGICMVYGLYAPVEDTAEPLTQPQQLPPPHIYTLYTLLCICKYTWYLYGLWPLCTSRGCWSASPPASTACCPRILQLRLLYIISMVKSSHKHIT